MVANPDFYLGKPKLKEVIYKILPDENTAATSCARTNSTCSPREPDIKWPRVHSTGRGSA